MLDCDRCALGATRLRETLALFYDEPAFRAAYEDCPASTVGHHAQLGGLLRHTVEVASIGGAAALACRADAELVFAGALLHDVGKVEAYRWQRGIVELTAAGALLGHVALGMLMLDRRLADQSAPPCSADEALLLQHALGAPEHLPMVSCSAAARSGRWISSDLSRRERLGQGRQLSQKKRTAA